MQPSGFIIYCKTLNIKLKPSISINPFLLLKIALTNSNTDTLDNFVKPIKAPLTNILENIFPKRRLGPYTSSSMINIKKLNFKKSFLREANLNTSIKVKVYV
jgi:hypothetical protein